MPPRKKHKKPTPVEALKHRGQRTNIPTEELRDFVRETEEAPTPLLYPRDPSLDPQLVWKGKDDQDRKPLEVPAVPIYIQEKVHPQALIENLRRTAKEGEHEPEQTLFADFNGVEADFERKIDFYSHDAGSRPRWTNRMILGDSLLVMASLAEKEGLRGQVQMIYMDPPYGIKFGSNWQVSTRKRDVRDGKVEDLAREPEVVKAFRDTWELGIHSYLAYLRDRLTAARDLLTDSGSIFVQIGSENVHLVRSILDEVFGSRNFCAQIAFRKTTGKASALLDNTYDVLLWYARNRDHVKYRPTYFRRRPSDDANYRYAKMPDGVSRQLQPSELAQVDSLSDDWRVFSANPLTSQSASTTTLFSFDWRGKAFRPGKGGWKTTADGMTRLARSERLMGIGKTFRFIRFFDDFPYQVQNDIWDDTRQSGFGEPKIFVVQTAPRVIERCLHMTTDPGDLVVDPTCGSATTAYVAEQWGRRWITIDTSRVALALARARLMTVKHPYYLLADSPEGVRREAEIAGSTAALEAAGRTEFDVKKGFVYKRVPHITLKSIANNEEIDGIWERFQEKLEPLRGRLNRALGQEWKEWEIPREADEKWSAEAKKAHEVWWSLRRERQAEIDASIARRADTELLYDQPCEDSKRIRVTGPFTVESLSPHRVLAAHEERPATEAAAESGEGSARYETMILDNLRKAGVQNTRRNERLIFERLEPFPGTWIHAAGEFTDASGESRRVAVSLGPEHGTVGPQQIQEAAKEAVKGIGFDLLLILGFAFDPYSAETAREISPEGLHVEDGFVAETERQYGKLPVLIVKMNPDLAMGDELLKKTGAGNLFMVFGEPDVEIDSTEDGKIVVAIKGVDIFDPTTGVIRSSSTDDIACWFLDTDYNGESFFVRHAYVCGAEFNQAYDRLQRALKADIDEAAWASLYRTESRPFDPPTTGRIAIKVINHYGDEVLRVYSV